MQNYLLGHEVVNAVQRERHRAGAAHSGRVVATDMDGKRNLLAGAHYLIGGALVRMGRSLQGTAVPSPEPAGR